MFLVFRKIENAEGMSFRHTIQAVNHRRRWTIEQLSALIRNSNVPKSDEWVQSALDWLVVHGLFLISKKNTKNPITAASAALDPNRGYVTHVLSGSVSRTTTIF